MSLPAAALGLILLNLSSLLVYSQCGRNPDRCEIFFEVFLDSGGFDFLKYGLVIRPRSNLKAYLKFLGSFISERTV